MLEASVTTFWLPKKGNAADEYEDAYAYSTHRFAIADGATESSYAERWAQGIVKQFIGSPPRHIRVNPVPLGDWLVPIQKEWQRSIPWDRLPWYAEEKARNGAFATFLGVEITPMPSRFKLLDVFRSRRDVRWHAIAVGDSCFFQVRNDALAKSFPIEKSEQFNSRPYLICSNARRNGQMVKNVQTSEGDCKAGDIFLLATDALSHWILRQHESGAKPWQKLLQLKSEADFAAFVEEARSGGMRNDDTTLVICRWKNGVTPT